MSTLNQFWNLAITKSTMLIAKLIEQVVGIAGRTQTCLLAIVDSFFKCHISWNNIDVTHLFYDF